MPPRKSEGGRSTKATKSNRQIVLPPNVKRQIQEQVKRLDKASERIEEARRRISRS